MTNADRYAIGDLARLAGVSRRTVRYYVQERLIAAPLGVGRGKHYGPEHLAQIRRIKAMQEAGKTLHEIRELPPEEVAGRPGMSRHGSRLTHEPAVWRRLTLAPGVELQIHGSVRLPSPGRMEELAAWCRLHLISSSNPEEETGDA